MKEQTVHSVCIIESTLILFLLFMLLFRLWSQKWTGCHISTRCSHQCSWTSQSQWLSTPKNTSRRFRTSSAKQTEGAQFTRHNHRLHFTVFNELVQRRVTFCKCHALTLNSIMTASAKPLNPHCLFSACSTTTWSWKWWERWCPSWTRGSRKPSSASWRSCMEPRRWEMIFHWSNVWQRNKEIKQNWH